MRIPPISQAPSNTLEESPKLSYLHLMIDLVNKLRDVFRDMNDDREQINGYKKTIRDASKQSADYTRSIGNQTWRFAVGSTLSGVAASGIVSYYSNDEKLREMAFQMVSSLVQQYGKSSSEALQAEKILEDSKANLASLEYSAKTNSKGSDSAMNQELSQLIQQLLGLIRSASSN